MKTRILAIALLVSIATNAWLAIELKRARPVLMNSALDAGVDANEDEAVESARELSFLRDLLSRWSTFQASTYLQSQVNVLPLLSPPLAEERKKEIQRIAKRMRDQSIEQESRLLRIEEKAPHVFRAVSVLDLNESGKMTSMKIEQTVETEKEIPSLENAWGFRAMTLTSKLADGSKYDPPLVLQSGRPTVLSFPCAVRGVSELDPSQLKFKLVTTKESELILQPQKNWEGNLPLQVECDRIGFSFELRIGVPSLRYAFVPLNEGRALPSRKSGVSHPNRNQVKRSLERELGFQIEESDR